MVDPVELIFAEEFLEVYRKVCRAVRILVRMIRIRI